MRIWITGASSGIGEAVALRYSAMGASLILTSSDERKLETVALKCKSAESIRILPFDFSSPQGVEELTQKAWGMYGGLDIVFLNAGISQRTGIEDTSEEMIRKIMEVDFFAPSRIAKALLPLMLSSGGGHIAVTSSIAGRFGFPLRCAYSSAKHALYGFFESMQAEYSSRGIAVTIVCPGRVRTNISVAALDKGGMPHGVMDPGQERGLDPAVAARRIVRAIDRGRREVLVGRWELLMVYVKRFFPAICSRLTGRISPM